VTLTITVSRGGAAVTPDAVGSAVWETDERGPGVFTFTVPPGVPVAEGDAVSVEGGGARIFAGYVFTRRREGRGFCSVTAYDQLRYLKNRDSLLYGGITASTLLRRIAASHGLNLGLVEDTKAALPQTAEDDKTLADILANALAVTELTGGRFILYDDAGGLTLRAGSGMDAGFAVGPGGAQRFTHTVSIDGGVCNSVKVLCDTVGGRREFLAEDPASIARCGTLRTVGRVSDPLLGRRRADELLAKGRNPRAELTLGGVPGDPGVRAGSILTADGSFTGEDGPSRWVTENARHTWKEGGYFMDLRLRQWGY
jgi:hypothetical protein